MRILIVEDEPKLSELLRRALTAERYVVDIRADGRAGLELAQAFPYDLIILDLLLPGMGGREVLQQVRRIDQRVPVLMLTARDTAEDKVHLFAVGADDYLTKPFAFSELLLRAKALFRRGPLGGLSTLAVGDLELDTASQQVRRAGKRIDVTAEEYSLLEYLMQNANRVLSHSMIIEHVWDQSFDGLANIVDIYMRHLRAKVDDGQSGRLIRTIQGSGYMICEAGE